MKLIALMVAACALLAGVALTSPSPTEHRIGTVVAVVGGTDLHARGPTPDQLAKAARGAVDFWESAGSARFASGEVVQGKRVVRLGARCDEMPPTDQLLNAVARDAGLDPGSLDHLVVYLSTASCDQPRPLARASVGEAGAKPAIVWLNGPRISLLRGFVAHELGHNLGLGHADRQLCEEGSCRVMEYGDPWSMMAVNYLATNPNATERAALGVQAPEALGANRMPMGAALTVRTGGRTFIIERDDLENIEPCSNPIIRELRPDGSSVLLDPYGRADACAAVRDGEAVVLPGGTAVTFRASDGGWLFVV